MSRVIEKPDSFFCTNFYAPIEQTAIPPDLTRAVAYLLRIVRLGTAPKG